MKKLINVVFAASVASAVAYSGAAQAGMKMPIKDHHQEIMKSDDGSVECAFCHGEEKDKFTIPAEASCLECHGTKDELAQLTERHGHGADVEPNPHDSLHYGTDLSCVYCHAEHKKTKIYCNHCHKFEYPDMPAK